MSRFSVKKPMTIFVAVIIVLALGIVSLVKMTPDLLPSIDLLMMQSQFRLPAGFCA